ncbi:hypothetical protein SLEP1_g57454 [Rubroshorea leprosula]|uniref:Uncharacterized protein n=1 Tax=Rubroshorea leprosula TaxID=152421 RepID=A0AAV5MMZ0_9ROSI|nr:hypothetical protein SLEP1_g57454 [Rubroshorea leprosula]
MLSFPEAICTIELSFYMLHMKFPLAAHCSCCKRRLM